MSAASLLTELSRLGVSVAGDGERLRYRGPREALTPALLGKLREHKAALLAELDRQVPIFESRVLIRTQAGTEVVEIKPVSPPGPTRWEKRLGFGGACALVGEVTTDLNVARMWVEVLQATDPGDEGATSPLGEMK